MAGRFSKQELKDKLQQSTLRLVAAGGIECVTVRKVSSGCGLSDPYIYQCYSDLAELMTDAFQRIDREIAAEITDILKQQAQEKDSGIETSCWLLWSAYWRFLLKDPDKTIFYWRFYQSGYFSRKLSLQRRENYQTFTDFIASVGEKRGAGRYGNPDAAVACVIDQTASVAAKIHLGYLNEKEVSPQAIYGTVFSYLLRLVGIDVWESLSHADIGKREEQDENQLDRSYS